jgi:hypothetical protein
MISEKSLEHSTGKCEAEYPSLNEWGKKGIFERVGNGKQTDDRCGQTLALKGCLNVEHAHVSLDGVNHTGKRARRF